MSWSKKYIDFGVLKYELKTVKVYSSQYSYISISVGPAEIKDCRWSPDNQIIVYLQNGKVRKYSSQTSYIMV